MKEIAFLSPWATLLICILLYLFAVWASHLFRWNRIASAIILGLLGVLIIPASVNKFQGLAQAKYWEQKFDGILHKLSENRALFLKESLAAKQQHEDGMKELRKYFYFKGTNPYELNKLIAYVTEELNESSAETGESYVKERINSLPERREQRKDMQEYNQRYINKLHMLWKPVLDMALAGFDSRVNAIIAELDPVDFKITNNYDLIVSKHETVPLREVRFSNNNSIKVILYQAEVRSGEVITELKVSFVEEVDGRSLPTFMLDLGLKGFELNPMTPLYKDIDSGTTTDTGEDSQFYRILNEGLNRLFDDTYFNHL